MELREEARGTHTPLEPEGSRVLPHAFMLLPVSFETCNGWIGRIVPSGTCVVARAEGALWVTLALS
jgi:hypothetical protein